MDDIVLERNLCFVDTPATSINRAEQTDAILHYVHQQLYRAIAAFDSPNGDFQNMLAGNGGSQVDAIIYLISQGKHCTHTFNYAVAHNVQIPLRRMSSVFRSFASLRMLCQLSPNQTSCLLIKLLDSN